MASVLFNNNIWCNSNEGVTGALYNLLIFSEKEYGINTITERRCTV